MKYLPAILLILASFQIYAQNKDEANTDVLEIYQVVDVDSTLKEVLFEKAINFFTDKENCEIAVDSSDFSLSSRCGFWYYKNKFLKSIEGNINYHATIEVKDNKYRYFLDDFVYYDYKRDRYGKYQQVKNSEEPLNDEKHLKFAQERMDELIEDLAQAMIRRDTPPVSAQKKFDDDW